MSKTSDWILITLLIGVAVVGGGFAMAGFGANVKRLAAAIVNAEGANVTGSLPNLYNNPGDLTQDTTGKGIGIGSQGLIQYASYNDGLEALYTQVQKMFDGTSAYYSSDMTIAQVAQQYATDWQNWANNVANYLGVSINTPISQI
jgi:hypothetical protein